MKHKRLSEEGFGEKGNYTIILPIDQGVEHGPVDAFSATAHPEMLDIDYQVDYIAELLHEGLVGATALPKRTANLLCKKYPHLSKDVILKLNHGNNLNKNLEPSQAVYASSRHAVNMGGVGFTIYPGSSNQDEMIEYYKLLPKNISPKLKKWAEINFAKSNNKKDYLNKILNEFNTNNFFYSLTPAMNGNDYEKFFFENKTGYCEYYAGTFTILARLAGIPSRIVTGYYGGSYNELGSFYIFKQEDAHSWVEVYIDNKWVRYDPTLSVPSENILETNNSSFINSGQSINVSNETKVSKINNIGIYFEYLNYVWTNSFLKYDEKSRNNFIKENLSNLDYENIGHYFSLGNP